eukprot:CAMPEP_0115024512 /NCGR_PEP_ID=MMETSP0216-20121206/33297_1 /TAXON_ID=223996 /ORGANISM="Protocruzia adherens, Strain Boccale" /LENGTH=996 /DNA_ID=CAMNT_0002398615 /DNA_START=127 /DNA_END=3117 /DNA_ORIENTATION=-
MYQDSDTSADIQSELSLVGNKLECYKLDFAGQAAMGESLQVKELKNFPGHTKTGQSRGVAICKDFIAFSLRPGYATVVSNTKPRKTISLGPKSQATDVAFEKFETSRLAVSFFDGSLYIWDLKRPDSDVKADLLSGGSVDNASEVEDSSEIATCRMEYHADDLSQKFINIRWNPMEPETLFASTKFDLKIFSISKNPSKLGPGMYGVVRDFDEIIKNFSVAFDRRIVAVLLQTKIELLDYQSKVTLKSFNYSNGIDRVFFHSQDIPVRLEDMLKPSLRNCTLITAASGSQHVSLINLESDSSEVTPLHQIMWDSSLPKARIETNPQGTHLFIAVEIESRITISAVKISHEASSNLIGFNSLQRFHIDNEDRGSIQTLYPFVIPIPNNYVFLIGVRCMDSILGVIQRKTPSTLPPGLGGSGVSSSADVVVGATSTTKAKLNPNPKEFKPTKILNRNEPSTASSTDSKAEQTKVEEIQKSDDKIMAFFQSKGAFNTDEEPQPVKTESTTNVSDGGVAVSGGIWESSTADNELKGVLFGTATSSSASASVSAVKSPSSSSSSSEKKVVKSTNSEQDALAQLFAKAESESERNREAREAKLEEKKVEKMSISAVNTNTTTTGGEGGGGKSTGITPDQVENIINRCMKQRFGTVEERLGNIEKRLKEKDQEVNQLVKTVQTTQVSMKQEFENAFRTKIVPKFESAVEELFKQMKSGMDDGMTVYKAGMTKMQDELKSAKSNNDQVIQAVSRVSEDLKTMCETQKGQLASLKKDMEGISRQLNSRDTPTALEYRSVPNSLNVSRSMEGRQPELVETKSATDVPSDSRYENKNAYLEQEAHHSTYSGVRGSGLNPIVGSSANGLDQLVVNTEFEKYLSSKQYYDAIKLALTDENRSNEMLCKLIDQAHIAVCMGQLKSTPGGDNLAAMSVKVLLKAILYERMTLDPAKAFDWIGKILKGFFKQLDADVKREIKQELTVLSQNQTYWLDAKKMLGFWEFFQETN